MTKEEHLLIILAEECGEIQHEIFKALRFGLDDVYLPESKETNRESLMREIADFEGALELVIDAGTLPGGLSGKLIKEKKDRIIKFLEYSKERGRL
jgi:hypothetical protein